LAALSLSAVNSAFTLVLIFMAGLGIIVEIKQKNAGLRHFDLTETFVNWKKEHPLSVPHDYYFYSGYNLTVQGDVMSDG
jgi:hypothetical protein